MAVGVTELLVAFAAGIVVGVVFALTPTRPASRGGYQPRPHDGYRGPTTRKPPPLPAAPPLGRHAVE